MKRKDLEYFLSELLRPDQFQDYGPNGLQIEGTEEITRLAFAVSATRTSVDEAVSWGAHALIVHHGLFWKFHGIRPLTGSFARRVFPLIKSNINLFGYHLPLDAHPEVGNAKSLANEIDLTDCQPFGEKGGMPTGTWGTLEKPLTEPELASALKKVLHHEVLYSKAFDRSGPIKKVGVITGGANSDWKEAARLGLDAYITGEMSEHDWHESAEAGVSMFAGGHHATERLGIQSLKKRIETDLGLETIFFDSKNPA